MSRCGYSDDIDNNWALIKWRGQVTSAIRGQRGQRLLADLVRALDAMPEKALYANELATADGEFCALGAVGKYRGMPVEQLLALDTEDYDDLATTFDIAHQLAQEVMWQNDEAVRDWGETNLNPAEKAAKRWRAVRAWACENLNTWLWPLPAGKPKRSR